MHTEIEFLGNRLENPVIAASGTFGFGYEFAEFYDINCLGSIALKGTTLQPKYGNPLPRIAECPAGLLNSIGLQNPGVEKVLNEELKKLKKVYHKKVIANVGGSTVDDYIETVAKFNDADSVFAVELNISCPNVKSGGMAFGTDPKIAAELVREVKKVGRKPLIVKLSPNVSDIASIAVAVEQAGADAISLINTLLGMRFDVRTAKPILAAGAGGYSGKGVYPIALRMVYQVKKAVGVPIIGMGGITDAYDVIEMMYAGASAVMIGTANLLNPYACRDIVQSLPQVMSE
ncbi:MAG: dihydroorotate dehydrogenase, partial [Clostridia bacterium]|nr:dihydroorotate dehydrogenase [Clostridia bacterium]